ncbi:MAG TPA: plastocyanin/azurin family copper-binding protein [Saprospiraceae bacterium]|nr:plastocyanin/azurin family copper-binding protein [Saprospiraceae bacterium]
MKRILRRLVVAFAVVIVPLVTVVFPAAPPATAYAWNYGCQYVVQPGDNLFRIGLRYGVNFYSLAYNNGLRNPNLVYAWMRLAVPCSTGYASQPYSMPGYSMSGYPRYGYPMSNYSMYGYPMSNYSMYGYPMSNYPTYGNPMSTYPTPAPMSTPSSTGQVMVVMRNIAFNPASVTIHAGQTVVWQNNDSAPHTTTSGSCPGGVCAPMPGWDSGTLNPGQSFSHTFATTGTFTYYCRIHGAMMQGTIVVMP